MTRQLLLGLKLRFSQCSHCARRPGKHEEKAGRRLVSKWLDNFADQLTKLSSAGKARVLCSLMSASLAIGIEPATVSLLASRINIQRLRTKCPVSVLRILNIFSEDLIQSILDSTTV
jgi:hypothetical protein